MSGRLVLAAAGGALWAVAVACSVADRAGAAGPWQAALTAGGWGLGLIPLHAVPACSPPSEPSPARRAPPFDAPVRKEPPARGPDDPDSPV